MLEFNNILFHSQGHSTKQTSEGVHPDIEMQGRRHQKFKT